MADDDIELTFDELRKLAEQTDEQDGKQGKRLDESLKREQRDLDERLKAPLERLARIAAG